MMKAERLARDIQRDLARFRSGRTRADKWASEIERRLARYRLSRKPADFPPDWLVRDAKRAHALERLANALRRGGLM